MKYERVLAEVLSMPWALLPEKLAELSSILAMRAAGHRLTDEEIEARISAGQERAAARGAGVQVGTVAVMPILGLLLPRADAMQTSGAVSVQALTARLNQLADDPTVGAIVQDWDSVGGSVGGVAEFADATYNARQKKPVIAIANPMMASAAYWVGSQASELIVSPSALTPSIGVYSAHADLTEALAKEGIKVEIIRYGENKALGHPLEPFSAEARAESQRLVDLFGVMFDRAVARGRGVSQETVRNSFGQGRVFGAQEAVKLGIADAVGTLDDAIALAARKAKNASTRADAGDAVPVAAGPDLDTLRLRARAAELA